MVHLCASAVKKSRQFQPSCRSQRVARRMSRTVFLALLLLCFLFVIINPHWVNDEQKVSLIQSGSDVHLVLTGNIVNRPANPANLVPVPWRPRSQWCSARSVYLSVRGRRSFCPHEPARAARNGDSARRASSPGLSEICGDRC